MGFSLPPDHKNPEYDTDEDGVVDDLSSVAAAGLFDRETGGFTVGSFSDQTAQTITPTNDYLEETVAVSAGGVSKFGGNTVGVRVSSLTVSGGEVTDFTIEFSTDVSSANDADVFVTWHIAGVTA